MPKNTAERIIDKRVSGGFVTAGPGRPPVAGPDGTIALEWIPQGAGSGLDADTVDGYQAATLLDHGAQTGLLDDDHTQYLLADGSRALSSATASRLLATDADKKPVSVSAAEGQTLLALDDKYVQIANFWIDGGAFGDIYTGVQFDVDGGAF